MKFNSIGQDQFIWGQKPFRVQWLSMVWDKIPTIWDMTDLANYSLDLHFDLTKFDYHENSNVADKKVRFQPNLSEKLETEVGSVKEKGKREISLINHINGHYFFVSPALEFSW